MWEEGYIRDRTSHRKSDFLFVEEFSLLVWLGSKPAQTAPESRVQGAESSYQEKPRKKQGTKGPEKHANCSPVRNIGVSGLMIISRRRRLLARSRSLRSAVIPKSSAVNTGDREKSDKEYVVSCMWRETRNLWSCVIGLIALKYTAALAHTLGVCLGWKPNPPCRATAMGTRKPEKGE